MAQQWFIERNGQVWGPFGLDHLQGFISSGHLRPDEMVLPAGEGAGIVACTIQGLRFSVQDASGAFAGIASWPEQRPFQPGAGRSPARKRWLLAGAGVVLAALGIAAWIRSHSEPAP